MPATPLRNQPLLTPEELASRLGELEAAIEQFNRRWYFESHETLEDLWQVTPWPERDFMQGIIQLAAAFVHYARREHPGILKLLDLSRKKLARFAPGAFGVDVATLCDDIERARSEIAALAPEQLATWDESGVPQIALRTP